MTKWRGNTTRVLSYTVPDCVPLVSLWSNWIPDANMTVCASCVLIPRLIRTTIRVGTIPCKWHISQSQVEEWMCIFYHNLCQSCKHNILKANISPIIIWYPNLAIYRWHDKLENKHVSKYIGSPIGVCHGDQISSYGSTVYWARLDTRTN